MKKPTNLKTASQNLKTTHQTMCEQSSEVAETRGVFDVMGQRYFVLFGLTSTCTA